MAVPLNILYLTHDLADAVTRKRAIMLKDGGATVSIAGFRRSATAINTIENCPVLNLGQTVNAGFVRRIFSVLRVISCAAKHQNFYANTDVIIARNLEMLAIGVRLQSLMTPAPKLVYESLDIHRLLLRDDVIGKMLRKLEGWLTKRASALITSSPAFVSEYFEKRSEVHLPVCMIENKIYNAPPIRQLSRITSPPWKIGWFGVIRCHQSLRLLTELVRSSAGNVEVIIRGKPALEQFADFYQSTTGVPGLNFLGPYQNPEDLEAIYAEVHFIWAIDLFEEGLNSSWLLPNRIYEGGYYGAVPLAQSSVETGRFLKNLGLGVLFDELDSKALDAFFTKLTASQYEALQHASNKTTKETWTCGSSEGKNLVEYLSNLTKSTHV